MPAPSKKNYKPMCVIIIKPRGVQMPPRELLRQAAKRNHDWCGYVTASGQYYRTLSFARFVTSFYGHVTQDDAAIIHFRLATHGSVATHNCHPFFRHGIYFAHNGVLPYTPARDITDSQFVFDTILSPYIEANGYDSQFIDGVRGISRFAFMQGGEIRTYGNFVRMGGLLLSNTYFL